MPKLSSIVVDYDKVFVDTSAIGRSGVIINGSRKTFSDIIASCGDKESLCYIYPELETEVEIWNSLFQVYITEGKGVISTPGVLSELKRYEQHVQRKFLELRQLRTRHDSYDRGERIRSKFIEAISRGRARINHGGLKELAELGLVMARFFDGIKPYEGRIRKMDTTVEDGEVDHDLVGAVVAYACANRHKKTALFTSDNGIARIASVYRQEIGPDRFDQCIRIFNVDETRLQAKKYNLEEIAGKYKDTKAIRV